MQLTPLAAAVAELRATLATGRDEAGGAVNALIARLAHDPAVDVVTAGPSGLETLEDVLVTLRFRGLERLVGDALDLDAVVALGRRLASRLRAFPHHAALERASWAWLDLARRAPVPRLAAAAGRTDELFALELALVEASRFTVGRLFAQRVETYGTRTLFRVPSRGRAGQYSWLAVAERASHVARGLLGLLDAHGAGPVALLSENRFELALVDIACLVHGVVTAMIPPDTTTDDLLEILARSGVAVCVVSGSHQLERLDLTRAPSVHTVVVMDRPTTRAHGVMTLADLERRGAELPVARLAAQVADLDADSLATVMYTSGTSGRPKGIRFTQRCLVSKRFARGLAIPTMDEGSVFLAYLPLYHTFGRYFEMLGAVFWGATYVFAEDTSIDALVESFRRFRPTVFISIPLKWVQLYEHIGQRVDLAIGDDADIARAVRDVVGDRLAVGLSAAGYLDPTIFRFFQRHGVELMSGFGMTEGTGGLLMTPPGAYREDTLGVPLPGTEVRLAEDGELLVRGAYVTPGYVDPEHDAAAWTEDRWLKTGDVMELDEAGYLRIVDRKKDIFKNVKGETIAPQRVERLFGEIDAVKRFVLIGDHRPFNTGLIVPNFELEQPNLAAMDTEELREHFRSHVVTANRFLAPFERVVDFAVLPRDFDEEHGELTPKKTLRRRAIEDNFRADIEALYQRGKRLVLPGVDVALRLPSWLFQALGVTVAGVDAVPEGLRVRATGAVLEVADRGRGADGQRRVRVGSSVYAVDSDALDLGVLLQTPALWLGN
ncbi:MAG: AMP-dependent synthetase, partial [Deltaproteobacteria bacterium]